MVKALFNRYQDEIVIMIWIIGIILSIFFFTNNEKYYLIPESVAYGKYEGRPVTYFRYTHDGVEGYLGISNISVEFCGHGCSGHFGDPFSRKAFKGNWDKYEKQGYFTINRKWWIGLIIPFCCLILMCIIYGLTDYRWKLLYSKAIPGENDCDFYCHSQSYKYRGNKYIYYCNCRVKDYCPYSDRPNEIFKKINNAKNIFLGHLPND
jgi:hypothetical protein